MAKYRKGLGIGKGSGWKNIAPDDPRRHGLSAKGVKTAILSPRLRKRIATNPKLKGMNFQQLQKKGVFLRYQADSDKDGVPNINDCQPLNKDMQDFKSFAKKVGAKTKELTIKGAKKTKELAEKGIEAYKESQERKKEEALREVKHPTLTKLDRQKERVEEIRQQLATEDTASERKKLDRELDKEEEQLRKVQEDVTKLKLGDLTDSQLKELAVRHKDESLFNIFGSGNRYEDELIRRIRKNSELTRKQKEISMREEAEIEKLEKRLREEKKRILEDKGFFG